MSKREAIKLAKTLLRECDDHEAPNCSICGHSFSVDCDKDPVSFCYPCGSEAALTLAQFVVDEQARAALAKEGA
jgi:hypothetical protein